MQNIDQTSIAPITVRHMPLLARRLELTRLKLASCMMGPKTSIPGVSILHKALAVVFTQAFGAEALKSGQPIDFKGGSSLSTALNKTSQVFMAVARVIEELNLGQRIKLTRSLTDESAIAAMLMQNAGLSGSDAPTPAAIIDLIHTAAAPAMYDSQPVMVRLLNRWLSLSTDHLMTVDDGLRFKDPDAALNAAILVRLYELWLDTFERPEQIAALDSTNADAFVAGLTAQLRSTAATLACIGLAAADALLKHALVVAEHTWLRATVTGRVKEDYERTLAYVKAHEPDTSGWGDWPEMCDPGLWDSSVISVSAFDDDRVPSRMVTLPPAISSYLFYSEQLTPVPLLENLAVSFKDQLWSWVSTCEMTSLVVKQALRQHTGTLALRAGARVMVDIPSIDAVRQLHCYSDGPGYPAVTKFDLFNPGPRSTAMLYEWEGAVIEDGTKIVFDRFAYYTLARVTSAIAGNLAYQPVLVGEKPAGGHGPYFPPLVPVFDPWDTVNVPSLGMSKTQLLQHWGVAKRDLERLIATLPVAPTSFARSPIVRGIAEALRFVGVVARASTTEDAGARTEVVRPFTEHYYHMTAEGYSSKLSDASLRAEAASIFGLSSNGDAEVSTSTGQIGAPIVLGALSDKSLLVFVPFKSLPRSADVTLMSTNLAQIDHFRVADSDAIVRWRVPVSFKQTGIVPIRGWQPASTLPGDIVAIPLSDAVVDRAYIEISSYDDTRPQYACRPNSILSVLKNETVNIVAAPQLTSVCSADGPIMDV